MHTHQTQVGRWGEDLAVAVLSGSGYRLIDKNWRPQRSQAGLTLRGEIDAVYLTPKDHIAFVEVKTRTTADYGLPVEALTPEKRRKLRELVGAWRLSHQEFQRHSYHIDVVSIIGTADHFAFEHRQAVV
ncbi:YraN family protein [Rothia sp. LK2588]|uniref:YraN family protein n=1 Tax=Rothia sp. LK2588 TaxID=3114369 RepID=UPI0034CEFB95